MNLLHTMLHKIKSCSGNQKFAKFSSVRFVLFLFLVGSLQAMSKPSLDLPAQIGVHTFEYADANRNNRPVVVEVWYPTFESGPYDTPEDPIWVHPKEIRDVIPSAGKHPMIMMSHGYRGDRRDRSWLAEYLVSQGYIVASVEHHGNAWRSYNPLLSMRFWDRSKDISFAISRLLKESFLKRKIDRRRIGFIGYSLGGLTGLALAGAKAKNVKSVIKKLKDSVQEVDDTTFERLDFKEAYGSYYDRRIKAMVLLSPAVFVFPSESLEKIRVPVALVASEKDEVLPHKEHGYKLIRSLGNAKLKILRNASHYVFLNRVSDIGKDFIRPEMQTEAIQMDRLKVHKEVGEFVVNFFKENFKL